MRKREAENGVQMMDGNGYSNGNGNGNGADGRYTPTTNF